MKYRYVVITHSEDRQDMSVDAGLCHLDDVQRKIEEHIEAHNRSFVGPRMPIRLSEITVIRSDALDLSIMKFHFSKEYIRPLLNSRFEDFSR